MKKRKKISLKPAFLLTRTAAGRFFRRGSRGSAGRKELPNWETLPQLIGLRLTAKLLDVHPNTLRHWDQEGKLRAVRLGSRQDRRYDRDEVRRLWLQQLQTQEQRFMSRWTKRRDVWVAWRRRLVRPIGVTAALVIVSLVVGNARYVAANDGQVKTLVLQPQNCSGWQQPQRALNIDLAETATPGEFTADNSAVYRTSFDRVTSGVDDAVETGSIDAPSGTFACGGFSLTQIPAGATMSNPALILSFASHTAANSTGGFVVETSTDGQMWTTRAVLPALTEKNGRQVLNLGDDENRESLSTLQVRIRPEIDLDMPEATAFLDGVGLQVTSISLPSAVPKRNKQVQQELNRLVAFSRATYASTETPVVTVPKRETKRVLFITTKKVDWTLQRVELVDSHGQSTVPKYTTNEVVTGSEAQTSINFQTAGLHPGKFTVKVAMRSSEGGEATIAKEFLWGVVALNFDRPNPRPGDVVNGEIGVLDDAGITICDALIEVKLTDPRGKTTIFNEKRKNLKHSGVCVDKGVTNQPDYSFSFKPERNGVYHISLVAKTAVGERKIEDNLIVDSEQAFDVQRAEFSSRIYPPAPYKESIAVTPTINYRGIVTERVPANFVISKTLPEAIVTPALSPNEQQLVQWPVDWVAGQTYYLRYTYDAPYISPAVFLLGPLMIEANSLVGTDWPESRPWQIASDAVTPVGEADFSEIQDDVISGLQPVYRSDEFIDVKVYKQGYVFAPGKVKKEISEAKSSTVTKVEMIGPDGELTRITPSAKKLSDKGRELEILHFQPARNFRPGQYTLRVTIDDGKNSLVEDRTFAWGVLAMNLRRSVERPNTDTFIGLGVLNADGVTKCDANITLTVTDPAGQVKTMATADDSIFKNPDCVDKGVTNDFDYAAAYTTTIAGVYTMRLTTDSGQGSMSIDDTFEVRDAVDFDIERNQFSMRIYPLADYPSQFTITSNVDYAGIVTEIVPAAFSLTAISDGGVAVTTGVDQVITWSVDWKAGEQHTLGYTIDYPDVSPEFYLLGPLTIGDPAAEGGARFQEPRQWQIASDSTGGVTRLYLHSDHISEENVSHSPMLPTVYPDSDNTNAAENNTDTTGLGQPCRYTTFGLTDQMASINEETANSEYCVATFYSPIIGANITLDSTDTSSFLYSLWAAEESTTSGMDPRFHAYVYEYVESGSTFTLVDHSTDDVAINGNIANYTWNGTPCGAAEECGNTSQNVIDAGNRIVVIFTIKQSATADASSGTDTIDVSFMRSAAAPAFIEMSYTMTMQDKPTLTSENDDDFDEDVRCASTCDNTTLGTTPTWTIQTSSNTTTETVLNGRAASSAGSSQWLSILDVKTADIAATTLANYTYAYQTGTWGDGNVSTQVSHSSDRTPTTDPRNFAGLVLRFSSDTDFLVLQSYWDGANVVVEVNDTGVLSGTTATITGNANNILLRWNKSGTSYQAKYCAADASDCTVDGNWTNLGSASTKSGTLDQIGLTSWVEWTTTTNVQYAASFEWFDSTLPALITVSGGCFTTESEGTPCGDAGAEEVKVAVAGAVDSGSDGTVDGAWSFTISKPASGASMIFFINGEATEAEEAVTATKYDGSGNVDLVKMYQSQLVIGTDSGSANSDQTVANTDLDDYLNGTDEDVIHTVSTCDLTVDAEANKTEQLYVISGDTYRPGSGGGCDAATLNLYTEGTITPDNNAFTISGNFDNDGVLTVSTSTFNFTAASGTNTIDADGTGAEAFYNVVFDDSAGSATFQLSTLFDADNNVTITGGNFDANGQSINVAGNWDNDDTFTSGTQTTTFDATTGTKTIDADGTGTDSFSTLTFNDAAGSGIFQLTAAMDVNVDLNITGGQLEAQANQINVGQIFNNDDIFIHGNNTIVLDDNTGTNVQDFDGTGTDAVYNLTVGAASSTAINQLSGAGGVDVDNDLTITDAALDAVSLPITVGGNWNNDGTFTSGTATVTFDAADTDNTIDADGPGTDTFSSVTFAGGDDSGTWALNTAMDAAATLNVDTSDVLSIDSGMTLTLSCAACAALTLNGTISGAGRLTYKTSTNFPTSGTISSILRIDATASDRTVPERTYGGKVELYEANGDCLDGNFTLATTSGQTLNFSSDLVLFDDNCGRVEVIGQTNNPIVNITGNLIYTTTGSTDAFITSGSQTWTVSGNIDMVDCSAGTASTFTTLTLNGTSKIITICWLDVTGTLTVDGSYTVTDGAAGEVFYVTGTLIINTGKSLAINSSQVVGSLSTGTITLNGTGEISGAGTLRIHNSNLGTGGTLSSGVEFDPTEGNIIMPARAYGGAVTIDIPNDGSAAANRTVTMAAGTQTFSSSLAVENHDTTKTITLDASNGGANNPTVNITGGLSFTHTVGAAASAIISGTGAWTVGGSVNFTDGTYTATAGNTLAMNGSGTLTTNANALQHFTTSGSGAVTLANATHTIAGNLTLGSSATITAGTSTVTMTGTSNTIDGGGQTLNALTIDPASAGTITLQNTDLTVSNVLTVASGDALTINNAARTLTLSRNTGTSLTITSATINGPGRLTYQNSAGSTFPTDGTLAATLITRFDTVNGNMIVPARTDYGVIEAFGSSANARVVTLGTAGSQTITTSSHLYVIANAASTNHVTLQGATWDPTLNVGGDFDFTGTGASLEIITAPDAAATWSISGNVNLQDNQGSPQAGTWTAAAETVRLNGAAAQTITSAGQSFYNLTLTNTSGTYTTCNSPLDTLGIYFVGSLTVSNNYTITTQGVKVQYDDAGTYTFQNVNWNGVATNGIIFRSDTTAAWDLDINGTQTDVSFVNVAYSDATLTAGGVVASNGTNTDCNNNTNWTFVSTIQLTGTCDIQNQSATDCTDTGAEEFRVAFGGSLQAQLDSTADGSISITGLSPPASGTIVTVFVNSPATNGDKAVAVTKYDGTGDITGITLYEEHVTIGSGDTPATLTSANLGAYDYSTDTDVLQDYDTDFSDTTCTTNSGGSSVCLNLDYGAASATEELLINSGWTFQPDSAGSDYVVTHDVENVGTLNIDNNSLTVSGSYVNSGTFTKATGALTTFTSTATGETITMGTGNFANLTFNGSGGDWTPSAAISIDEVLTMTAGQLKGTQNVTVLQDAVGTAGTINLTGGTFEQRVGGTEPFGPTTSNTDWIFNNLTFSRSAGTAIIDTNACSNCEVTVVGILELSKASDGAGTTLQAGDKSWILTNPNQANPFNNDGQAADAGVLTAETSTFEYAGDADAADVTIENATYFNLTLTSDGVAENYDAAGTSASTGTLTTNANGTLIGADDWSFVNVTSDGSVALTGGTATFTATGAIGGSGTRTFNNLTTSGTGTTSISATTIVSLDVSVGAGTTFRINADLTVNGGDITTTSTGIIDTTAGTPTTTLTTSGNVGGGSGAITFYNLTHNGAGATTSITSNATVSNALTVGAGADSNNDTVAVDSAKTLTLSANAGTSLVFGGSGTDAVNGPGTLTYQNSAGSTFPTTGSLGSTLIIRFDTLNGNMIVPARTDYGVIEAFGASANARTVTLGTGTSQTITTASNFYVIANADTPNHITIQGATWDPTLNVGGDFDFTGTGTASEQVTAPDAAATWTVTGNVDLTAGTWTASAETLKMNGSTNLIGAGQTIKHVTIDGTNSTVTVTGSDVTVSGTLTIGGDAAANTDVLSIGAARQVISGTGGTVTITGSGDTISGSGTLVVQNSNLGTAGTLSSVVRFDATNGDITSPARTYGAAVQLYSNSGTAKVITFSTGTMDFDGAMTLEAAGAGTLNVTGATNDPAYDLEGDFSMVAGGGVETFTTGNGNWNAAGAVNLTNGTYTTEGTHTLIMDGASKTLTTDSEILNNLTFSGTGTTTLADTVTAAGNVVLNSTIGAGSLTMSGTTKNLTGGSATLSNLTTSGTITLTGSDLTVDTLLTISNALTIASSRIMTLSRSATAQSLTMTGGTLHGPGTLVYQMPDSVANFPTDGTLGTNTVIRFDTVNGNQKVSQRSDYDSIVAYKNGTTARSVILGTAASQTLTISADIDIQNANATNALTLDGNTNTPVTVNVTGNVTNSVGTGDTTISMGSGTWTVTGNFDLTNADTFNHNSGTLTMDGSFATLTTNSKTLNNLNLASAGDEIFLGTGTHTLAGNLVISGVVDAVSSTVLMSGTGKTIDGGGQTLNNLQISGTVTLQNTDLTVGGLLTVDSAKSLTLNASRTLTLSKNSGTSLTITGGTVNGPGRLTYQNSAGSAFPTDGTLAATLINRFDTLNGNQTLPSRIDYGALEVYNATASNRTVFSATGTVTASSTLNVNANSTGNIILDLSQDSGAGATNPAVNVTGDITYTKASTGTVTIVSGTGTWTASGAVNFTNGVYTATAGNTLVMNGASKTLTTNANALQNLTFSGSGTTTLADNISAAGNVILNSTISAGSTTLTMTGTTKNLTGGSATLNDLTISGTVTLITSDLTVGGASSGLLTIDVSKSLTIDTSRTLVLPRTTGSALSLSGTLNGPGRLTYRTSTAFPTTGALGAVLILRYDMVTNAMTSAIRTDYGTIEAFNSSGVARILTIGAGTHTLAGDFLTQATGTGNVTVTDSTNDAAINITGSLGPCSGGGAGSKSINFGELTTWTVSTNVDFTNCGTITQSTSTVLMNGTGNLLGAGKTLNNLTVNGTNTTVTVTTTNLLVAGILTVGATTDGNTDVLSIGSGRTITSTSAGDVALVDSTDTISGAGTLIMRHGGLNTAGTFSANAEFDGQSGSFTAPARVYGGNVTFTDLITGGNNITLGGPTWTVSGNMTFTCAGDALPVWTLVGSTNNPAVNITGDFNIDDAVSSCTLDLGSGTWTVGGNFDLTTLGTLNHNNGTLVMNGASKTLTSADKTLHNVTFSGSGATVITSTLTASGNVALNSSNTSGYLIMTGSGKNLTGGSATLGNLTISNTSSTITLTGSDLTVDTLLTVSGGGGSLTLAAGRVLTLSRNNASSSLTLAGTLTGSGTLVYQNSLATLTTAGTLSSAFTFDVLNGNETVPNRIFGGLVTALNTTSSARTLLFGTTVTPTLTGFDMKTTGTGTLLVDGATNNPATVTVTGALTASAANGGITLSMGSGNWNVSGNVDLTNVTTLNHNSGTVTLNGAAQQTLTSNSKTLNHLTITNASGSDPDSSPSVIFADGLTTAGTLTAATANTKLRLASGSTYAPTAINFTGTAGNLVTLRSSSPGTAVTFNAGAGSRTVTYTSVKDNDACGSSGGSIDASDGTNVDGGNTPCWVMNKITVSLSANGADLGTMSATIVSQAGVTSTITANSATGYVSLVKYDQVLTSGGNTIGNTAGGTIVAGENEYGASSSQSGNTIAQWSPTTCSSTASTSNATALSTSFQSFASKSTPATAEVTTLCLLASTTGTQQPGAYTSTLTIVTTARF